MTKASDPSQDVSSDGANDVRSQPSTPSASPPTQPSLRTVVYENSSGTTGSSFKSHSGFKTDSSSSEVLASAPNSLYEPTILTAAPDDLSSDIIEEKKEEIEDTPILFSSIRVDTMIASNFSSSVEFSQANDQSLATAITEESESIRSVYFRNPLTSQIKSSITHSPNNSLVGDLPRRIDEESSTGGFCALLRNQKAKTGLLFCFCILVTLQSFAIVYLLLKDDDNDGSIPSSPTTGAPTPLPPPVFPFPQFQNLFELPGTEKVPSINDCDNCKVQMPTPPIPWSDRQKISSLEIFSDGRVVVNCDNEVTSCGTIHVMETDLANHISGYVLYNWMPDVLIISWEQVWSFGYRENLGNHQLNGQVLISTQQQQVQICFGSGDTHGIAIQSGYYNYTSGEAIYIPFMGPTFDENGFSLTFPKFTCQILGSYSNDSIGPTNPPASRPNQSLRPVSTQRPTCLPTDGPCFLDLYGFRRRSYQTQDSPVP